jgi:regulator of sigma E protease
MGILLAALSVVFVVFLLGLCIFVHELGHLLVALWRRLHVERFSIGFGKKLWGKTVGGVEYMVSALPFGGYVALPQLDPSDRPADSRDGTPLPHAKPLDRILTAFAGPFFNILFGFLLATILWHVGMYKPVPADHYVVHSVQEGSAEEQAGLRPRDTIWTLNGKPVPPSWSKMVELIVLSTKDVTLGVEREGDRLEISYPLEASDDPAFGGLPVPSFQVREPVVVESLKPGFPAEEAGLREGDRLLSVNANPVQNPVDFVDKVRAAGGAPVTIEYQSGGEDPVFVTITPQAVGENGETAHIIGVIPGVPTYLAKVNPWQQFLDVLDQNKRTLGAVISSKSKIGAKDMSGPLGILRILYLVTRTGAWRRLLWFLILINFGLAILNLLPIPVLDGGHILMAVAESVFRRRIPHRLAYILQTSCAILLIGFILYVSGHDLKRMFLPFLDKSETGEAVPPAD